MHIGLIPDGNRRYAKSNGLSVDDAYRKGFEAMVNIIDEIFRNKVDFAVDVLTIYVCSIDNLTKRSPAEVACIHQAIGKFIAYYNENRENLLSVKVNIIGNLQYLPSKLRSDLRRLHKRTANYTGNVLNLAIGYDAYKDMIHYNRKAIKMFGYTSVNKYKQVHPVSDLDLVIRTGFEKRISGFFPMQTSYAELFFIDKHFPQFTVKDIKGIVDDYKMRQRRFGN